MRRSAAFALAVALLVTAPAAADPDLFLLIHPKCSLDPEDAEKAVAPKTRAERAVAADTNRLKARFVAGARLEDVPRKGECFIVELPPTKVASVSQSIAGIPEGATELRRFMVVAAEVEQPYKVWYCKDADARPELLGQSFMVGMRSPWVSKDGGRAGVLLPDRPPELARKELTRLYKEEFDWARAVADKVVVGKPTQMTAKEFLDSRKLPGRKSYSYLPPPQFKPARVVPGADGGASVEVDLHNRLPARVRGTLQRQPAPAEAAALDRLPDRERSAPGITTVNFELEPGEKKTVSFQLPRELARTKAAAQSQVTVNLVLDHRKK
jgi:hypothetical protein